VGDGEAVELTPPLEFVIRPAALTGEDLLASSASRPPEVAHKRRDSMTNAGVPVRSRPGRAPAFRAVALGIDGTLADGSCVPPHVLAALQRARVEGRRVVLVTGRTVGGVRDVLPDVLDHVDAVVAENGAVLLARDRLQAFAAPVEDSLAAALADRGIEMRRGAVIGFTGAGDEHDVLDEIRRLGLEYQLVRNRNLLMILPAGVNKGSGLLNALRHLGVSPHDTLAIGDAENDHSLFDVVEFGVAVADAVGSLRERADLVLDGPDGTELANLLAGDLLNDPSRYRAMRRHLVVGVDDRGEAVRLPSSPRSVLVAGGSRGQRLQLSGLLAEQLTTLGYSVLIVDQRGDFPLDGTPERLLVGADRSIQPPTAVLSLLRHAGIAVADLSYLDPAPCGRYLEDLWVRIRCERQETGLPHWVFTEDRPGGQWLVDDAPGGPGRCMLVERPSELPDETRADTDAGLILAKPRPDAALVGLAVTISGLPSSTIRSLLTGEGARVLVVSPVGDRRATSVSIAHASGRDSRVDSLT
jgi:hydroxymethylpyrimidine pyrophosphatase-like HAD family hydrolase